MKDKKLDRECGGPIFDSAGVVTFASWSPDGIWRRRSRPRLVSSASPYAAFVEIATLR